MARETITRALPVAITLAEAHAMMAAARNERDRLLFGLLWHSGGRVSEVILARVGDVTTTGIRLLNLKQHRIRKLADGSKVFIPVREEKHVLLPKSFLAELWAFAKGKAPEEYLITRLDSGHPITRQTAWFIVTTTAAQAAILKRRFSDGAIRPAWAHVFRHGLATNLLSQGAPVTLVQRQLGHKSLASTQVYTQLTDPTIEKFINGARF